jgi:ketosteroid isomerase-like protein
MTDRETVSAWLDAYVAAWKSYDREAIAALWTEDARQRYHPFDEWIRGREAIVESWLDEPDEPGTYDASYAPVVVDGDVAVATGTSTYYEESGSERAVYDNCFLMRFDESGRCAEFTEWFMERPGS